MNIRIKNYLQQMSKYISNKAAKQNAIIEIENHLLDQIDFYMEQGYSEDEATHMAIKEATDPKELGKKLNLAPRPFIYRYPFTLFMGATTCLSLIAVIIISHFSMEVLKENYIQGHISERVFEKFYTDMETLKKNQFFEFSRKKNIGPYLLSHHDFYAEKAQIPKNLSFLDQIIEYDHWNIYKDPDIFHYLEQAKAKDYFGKSDIFAKYSIPNMSRLYDFVNKRVEELITLKKLELAEKLIDKTAQIFLSTHTLLGGVFASKVLKSKNIFIKKYYLINWKEVPNDMPDLYKRTSFAWNGVLDGYLNNVSYAEKIKPFLKKEYGVCIGLVENLPAMNSKILFFGDNNILEPRFVSDIGEQKKVFNSLIRDCDISEIKSLTLENSHLDLFGESNVFTYSYMGESRLKKVKIRFSQIPFIRTIIGSYLGLVGIPISDSMYQSMINNEEITKI